MSAGAIIGIIIAIVVIAAAAALATQELRRARLRRQFGPEYSRLVKRLGSNRKAEAELRSRQRKAAKLDIRPLSAEQQQQYATDWGGLQERFIDSPAEAVAAARRLISRIMRDRGYPDGDGQDMIVNLSVHHPRALDDFRQAEDTSDRVTDASTEDLRVAMIRYRILFRDLTGAPRDSRPPMARAVTRKVPVTVPPARPRQEA